MGTVTQLWYYTWYTETEIQVLTNATPWDLYEASDSSVVYKIQSDGTAALRGSEVLVIARNNGGVSESVLAMSAASWINTIDATQSTLHWAAAGASQGLHLYSITSMTNDVDLSAPTVDATLIAWDNVTIVGEDVEKSIATNWFNASFYSWESYNPNEQNFAVSYAVESVTGTIREFWGIDDNPSANESYTSMEYAVYQINNYIRIYESNVGQTIPEGNFIVAVWDRIGFKVQRGIVTVFVLRGWAVVLEHVCAKKATSPMFFKWALNRWDGQSGDSLMGDVNRHTGTQASTLTAQVFWNAAAALSPDDVERLENIGMDVQAWSTYSLINYIRKDTPMYDDWGAPYDLDIIHSYSWNSWQSSDTATF